MRAITIKHIGPTATKGPRVKASITLSELHKISATVNLRGDSEDLIAEVAFAAEALLDDLGWTDCIITEGSIAEIDGETWVAIPKQLKYPRVNVVNQ